jgi:hypothetical protein
MVCMLLKKCVILILSEKTASSPNYIMKKIGLYTIKTIGTHIYEFVHRKNKGWEHFVTVKMKYII